VRLLCGARRRSNAEARSRSAVRRGGERSHPRREALCRRGSRGDETRTAIEGAAAVTLVDSEAQLGRDAPRLSSDINDGSGFVVCHFDSRGIAHYAFDAPRGERDAIA
jgi:hypothetical protein